MLISICLYKYLLRGCLRLFYLQPYLLVLTCKTDKLIFPMSWRFRRWLQAYPSSLLQRPWFVMYLLEVLPLNLFFDSLQLVFSPKPLSSTTSIILIPNPWSLIFMVLPSTFYSLHFVLPWSNTKLEWTVYTICNDWKNVLAAQNKFCICCCNIQLMKVQNVQIAYLGCTRANKRQNQHPKGPSWNFNGMFHSIISSISSNFVLKIFNDVNNGIFNPKYHQFQ